MMSRWIAVLLALSTTIVVVGGSPAAGSTTTTSAGDEKAIIIVRAGQSPRAMAHAIGWAVTEDTTCDWVTVTMSRDSVYLLEARLDWCHNGVASGGYGTWSATPYGAYYLERWTNPPNDYYDPNSFYTIHTVGQARFCAAWCTIEFTPGVHIWGNADGSFGIDYL